MARGTFDKSAYNEDQALIEANQYPGPVLISLPLQNTLVDQNTVNQSFLQAGMFADPPPINISQYIVTPIAMPQLVNGLALVSHAFDAQGLYHRAPMNTPNTSDQATTQYAFGFAQLNGVGPWIPLSLMPSDWANDPNQTWWAGGFGSIAGAIRSIAWAGFVVGYPASQGPQEMLALAGVNFDLGFASEGVAGLKTYAVPSGT